MILLTPKIKQEYPKAFRAARKSRFRAIWLEDDLVYVARRGKGHGRYLVSFTVVQGINKETQVYVSCRTITNGPCGGCKWNDCCSHIAMAVLRWQAKHTKHEQKEAA